MPADIGEMFYTDIDERELLTAEDPPSPAHKRKAIVRLDRPAGHEGRVIGVVHQGFQPVQNRDGAMLFDMVDALLPEPKKPRNAARNTGLLKAWENRVADAVMTSPQGTLMRVEPQGLCRFFWPDRR